MRIIVVLLLSLTWTASAVAQISSKDAYVQSHAGTWVIGSGMLRMVLRLDGGSLAMTSFRNQLSQTEYVQANSRSDEIRLGLDGKKITGRSGDWFLVHEAAHKLAQGEVELDLTLSNQRIEVTKHYVAYPGAPLIREWMSIRNISAQSLRVDDPALLQAGVLGSGAEGWNLYYITGGGPYSGSQLLKKEAIGPNYKHEFDSHANGETAGYTAYTVYLPLIALHNSTSNTGMVMGWDYLGHWTARVENNGDGPYELSLQVSGYEKTLGPDVVIETPRAFLGVFSGDLDDMGNSLLDWQYGYMWDLTRPDYFAKTRWGVDWPQPWIGSGGTPSGENWGRRLALDLRYVDLMRQTGGDILWDDAGWYDRWGDWNGPDWKMTTDYLRKHEMKWVLWWPTFMAQPLSRVAQEHPEWMVPAQSALNQSVPATMDYQNVLLDKGLSQWGDFQWRFDAPAAISKNDTDILDADRNFRGVIGRFKSEHPASGVDACWGGGRWIDYDLVRLADSGEYTDGGVGPYTAYYTSLLAPPDKLHNVVDFDHTYYNAATDRTHLCLDPTWYRDPGDGASLEAIRKDWDIYHYLLSQGVAGRWSHVFRPVVEHDDPIWYFQRMDRTQSKGIIISRHSKTGPEYFLVARQIKKPEGHRDIYFAGGNAVTTAAAAVDTGVYEDPVDRQFRFFGASGEIYGWLNFKYRSEGREESFVKAVTQVGSSRRVGDKFFGMAIQVGAEPITITQLGMLAGDLDQFMNGFNRGTYLLTVVRASDRLVVGSTELDMSHGVPDALGFKYAKLANPIKLEGGPEDVVVRPRGLEEKQLYEVGCDKTDCRTRKTGRDLMQDGIRLSSVQPGELIYLNLTMHPGSDRDKSAPQPPSNVVKRVGTNLGVQGVEVSWTAGWDDNWISYYEVLRDGVPLSKVAKGKFLFDYSGDAQKLSGERYEVQTVDGSGNRSGLVTAKLIAGDVETYRALGGFGLTQEDQHWLYEESFEDNLFRPMRWTTGGYEGRWVGSGIAQIGRIWMQPGADSDVVRGFVAPTDSTLQIGGEIRKDPSARDGRPVDARILLNERQIWPASGWQEISPEYENATMVRLDPIRVKSGDVVRFVVRRTGNSQPEPLIWDPVIIVNRKP